MGGLSVAQDRLLLGNKNKKLRFLFCIPLGLHYLCRRKNEISIGRVMINGHYYVDLGLSVLWATCNVGAKKEEEYGDYYAWGETAVAQWNNYSEENCKSYGVGAGDISGDGRYDVARVKWGGTWRMPTRAEFDELQEECEWEWTTQKDIYGYKVTGPNGNTIFLPAAGMREGSTLNDEGTEGSDYWSATPFDDDNRYASCGYPMNEDHDWNVVYRYYGLPVRAVADITGGAKKKREINSYIDDKIYYIVAKKRRVKIATIVIYAAALGLNVILVYVFGQPFIDFLNYAFNSGSDIFGVDAIHNFGDIIWLLIVIAVSFVFLFLGIFSLPALCFGLIYIVFHIHHSDRFSEWYKRKERIAKERGYQYY